MAKISVVINTLNEEKNIKRAISSVEWADEIVVMDDGSTDQTLEILSKLKIENGKLKIFKHKSAGYVEPTRNFAISKASNEWVLVLDADEEIPESLAKRLKELANRMKEIDYVGIPRKNIIFGKWMKASMWWPDYNVRFFRKGKVIWSDKIHSKPKVFGQGLALEAKEDLAIVHHHYSSIFQFVERMNRYSDIQAKELQKEGALFHWSDLIQKPLSEFLSRFFANRGYEDGIHGLALSFLQAMSFLLVYLKLWEMGKFQKCQLTVKEVQEETAKAGQEIKFWFGQVKLSPNPFKRFFQKTFHK